MTCTLFAFWKKCVTMKERKKEWTKCFQAAKESEIPTLVRFAVQKEKRLSGLAAHAIHPISTGKLEGFNNKIKVAKRIGYGYRDDDFFFTLIRYLSIPSVRFPSHKKS
ncbi:transposase [uncultured Ruminococcus sp.]|nr:transposase [uncultured Ruminococcus sp.]